MTERFPLYRYERTSKTCVWVTEYIDAFVARLSDGTTALRRDLTSPAWLIDALHREADARSERATQRGALDVGVQW